MMIRVWWMVRIGVLTGLVTLAIMPAQASKRGAQPTVEALIGQANAKRDKGDLSGAAATYKEAFEKDESSIKARQGLAVVLVEGQIKESSEEHPLVVGNFLEETASNTSFPSARFPLGFLANGALGANDQSMSGPVLEVLTKLQQGENEAALTTAEQLRKQNPTHPVPYNLLGLAWQGTGDPSKARDLFQKALALNEDFHAARINLAELKLHLGEFSSANKDLERVLKNDKNNRRACLVMAHLYTLEGKADEAKRWYQKASEPF